MIQTNTFAAGLYPFWFWNGEQNKNEITRQLHEMAGSGCRGVTIHCRAGNKIPYLGEQWMELIRHAVMCAANLNLKVWMYDEDGFPSGHVSQRIPTEHPDLRLHYLTFEYATADPKNPAWAAYRADSFERVDEAKLDADTLCLRFDVKTLPLYKTDTLNPEASRLFIEICHKKYEKAIGEFFGSVVQAFYTDDECFGDSQGLAWSPCLPDEYKKRYNEDIMEILPSIVENRPNSSGARHRYFSLVNDLFLTHFIRPQADWCHSHGMLFLGHLCCDEGPRNLALAYFRSFQAYQMMLDAASIDDFLLDMTDFGYLRNLDNYNNHTLKHLGKRLIPLPTYLKAASVAHQFKQDWFSAEVLTLLKWNCPFWKQHRQILFELAMGVNLVSHHAFYYTIGGLARYDCPPSYFLQQPYWKLSCDYLKAWTRIATLLKRGISANDTLLIEPSGDIANLDGSMQTNASFHCMALPSGISPNQAETLFGKMVLQLMRNHTNLDIAEETHFLKYANLSERRVSIGAMTYSRVIVPDYIPLMPETSKILKQMEQQGVSIIHANDSWMPSAAEKFDSELLSTQRRMPDGTIEAFYVNLSNHDISPSLNGPFNAKWYDPIADAIIHVGPVLPMSFTMAPGSAIMRMSHDFSAPYLSFDQSQFTRLDSSKISVPIMLATHFERQNLLAIPGKQIMNIFIPNGATVSSIYGDGMLECTINGQIMRYNHTHHPIDCCFNRISCDDRMVAGSNTLVFDTDNIPEFVFLEGDFRTDGVDVFPAEPQTPVTLGDLGEQGFPHYWGSISYVFCLPADSVALDLDCCEMAEISLNGSVLEVIPGGKTHLILPKIYKTDSSRSLEMTVRVFTPAGNMVEHRDGEIASYRPWKYQTTGRTHLHNAARWGIFSISVSRTP